MDMKEDETQRKERWDGSWYYKYTCQDWGRCHEDHCPLQEGDTVFDCAVGNPEETLMIPSGTLKQRR